MIKVVMVGDEPSRTNVNSNIAFVGARCFNTVVKWIKILKPDYYICLNSNTNDNLYDIQDLYKDNFKVIALGKKASDRLNKLGIQHFALPHPSGLNLKLNDNEYISSELNLARKHIGGK